MRIWICASLLSSALLADQAPARSFADLPLKEGHRVTIVDDKGNTTRGRVVSVAGTHLEVVGSQEPRRSTLAKIFGVPQHAPASAYRFAVGSVRRIKKEDSAWNGALIGIGLGGLLGVPGCASDPPDELCPIPVIAMGAVGGVLGYYIDGLMEKTVFASPGTAKVSINPLIGGRRVGIAAAFRF